MANNSESADGECVPTKSSEITIVMRTIMSSGAGNAKNELVQKATIGNDRDQSRECSTGHGCPAGSNRIEVTTSVRTVLECPAVGKDGGQPSSAAAACVEAAAVASILQPVLSKNFIALLKSANDSSFENVLEFKSLLAGAGGGSGGGKDRCRSCEQHSKHGLSSDDSEVAAIDEQATMAAVVKKAKTDAEAVASGDPGAKRNAFRDRLGSTSTPIKIRIEGGEQRPDGMGEDYRLNLLTPPADASFIDSDFESMEQDQYDTCSSKGSSRMGGQDHQELTAQQRMLEELACLEVPVTKPSPPSPVRKAQDPWGSCSTTSRKSSSSTKAFFEEALRTPLAIRKHFQKRRNSELPKQPSHGNLLNFFTAKKKSNSLEGGLKSPRAKRSLTCGTATTTTSENSSENGSRCVSPALTEENLRRLSVAFVRRESDALNRTLVWGENYDYSFECEPSHSDVDEEDEHDGQQDDGDGGDGSPPVPLTNTISSCISTERRVSTKLVHFELSSPDSSYELQPPIVPSFKIDPPGGGACSTSSGVAGLIIGAAAYATATTTASFLKRSASEPLHCKLRSHSCTPLTSDIGESDEEDSDPVLSSREEAPIMCKALVPVRPFTSVHQASVRSLDKIGGKQINHSASPFRRWGQSSLRSRSTEHRTPNGSARRPSSLAASESDVYTKSIDDDYSSTKSGYNPYGGGSCGDVLAVDSGMAMHGTGTGTGGKSTGTGTGGPTGVASWGTSFEKLLEDAAGLHTFSEFLKKEFSAENIYFWTACERYRQLTEREDRAREAQAIFARHLESGCSDPVNVDSIARNIALEHLPQAETTLFAAAQKQIFNLMKFDSYQRFIKSDLYRVCQEAEAKGHPLPYPGDQLDPMLRTNFTMVPGGSAGASGGVTKLKKSLSNAEDRRRKSLLPWHRKTRCKSKDRGDSDASKKDGGKGSANGGNGTANGAAGAAAGGSSSSNTLKLLSTNSTSDIHSSRSSLASFDAAIGGKSYDPDDTRTTLCRVILSNGATTVVQTRSNETIKELVERLLEKRGIVYNAYEAFLASSSKPLDLDGPSVSLAGKEVNIDQRVVFKLNLPNRKMISVKSKATKPLADVLRPILHKYNYELDQMKVTDASDVGLDMTQPVTTVDGLCLYIRSAADHSTATTATTIHPELGRPLAGARPVINTATHQQIVHHFQQQQQQLLNSQSSASQQHQFAVPSSNLPSYTLATNGKSRSFFRNSMNTATAPSTCNNNNNSLNVNHNHLRTKEQQGQHEPQQFKEPEQPLPPASNAVTAHNRGQQPDLNTLDEITNKVFNELMNGKTASNGATGKGPPDVDCASDTSSSRRDRFRRRGSNAPSESGRGAKSKKCSTGGSEDGGESVTNGGTKKPIIAKLKAGVKLQMPTRSQNDELLEGLKRAQRSRLEDQRGTEINFELPDFLKDKENFTSSTGTSGAGSAANSQVPSGVPAPQGGPTSKLTRSKPARRSEATTPTAEFVGGSLQQINKPQPAPRLSITGGQTRGSQVGGPGSPVHAAVSDSQLNLSTQCNASPLPLDDPFRVRGGESQSENSYADTTLVFTHATPVQGQSPVAATPRTIIHHRHHQDDGRSDDQSSDSSAAEDPPCDDIHTGCCDHPYDTSPDCSPPPAHGGQLHPHHYHHATPAGAPGGTNPTHYPPHHHHHHNSLLHHAHHHPHGQHYHHHHHPGTRYQATNGGGIGSTNATVTPLALALDSGQPAPAGGDQNQKGPPPLPPKPKILPMKPSNWGHPGGVTAPYSMPNGDGGSHTGTSGSTSSSGTSSTSGSTANSSTSSSSSSSSTTTTTNHQHHSVSANEGVGGGTAVVGSNGILSSNHNELANVVREGNRRASGGIAAESGSSVISSSVAQARSVYFDQGSSSFV
ncbi:AGAP002411-PC-like protein [Anopheles sinensis]|uniref:AGAP002411-PC-like protein n=1 Tax=Anopheles sinensis TaxID=74873 RepID=A0A084VSE1_ANOSI|nr:AGAP002411-PC-like protein [Anopheles sinensis]